jgi:hypothetical protein
VKQLFSKEIEVIKAIDSRKQYLPLIEGYLKNSMKIRIDKCVGKQMKPL